MHSSLKSQITIVDRFSRTKQNTLEEKAEKEELSKIGTLSFDKDLKKVPKSLEIEEMKEEDSLAAVEEILSESEESKEFDLPIRNMCYKSHVPLAESQKQSTRKIGSTMKRMNIINVFLQEKARIEKLRTRITSFMGDIDDIDDIVVKKTALETYCTEKSSLMSKKSTKGGNRVGLESEVFDQVLNILIGIRRSLNNISELPG